MSRFKIRKQLKNFDPPQCQYWILDTDVGGDDAQAIIVLIHLAAKLHKTIVGITCCNGNAYLKDVVKNTLITLAVCGADIPIYPGAQHSLVLPDSKDFFFGQDGFCQKQLEYQEKYREKINHKLVQTQHASVFISQAAEKYKGNIGIITIGPLTNLAIAQLYDENVASNIKTVSIMGGNYTAIGMNRQFSSEFNFTGDVQAAHIVLKKFKNISLVTIETAIDHDYKVTMGLFLDESTPRGKLVHDLYLFVRKVTNPMVCDPLAVLAVLAPKTVLSYYKVCAQVMLQGFVTRGYVAIDWFSNFDDKPSQNGVIKIIKNFNLDEVNKIVYQSYK